MRGTTRTELKEMMTQMKMERKMKGLEVNGMLAIWVVVVYLRE